MITRKFKQMKKAIFGLILVVLCMPFFQYVKAEEISDIKNILIINSYHEGFVWTRDEVIGILDTVKAVGNNIAIQVEYMDWKNYPTSQNIDYLYNYYKYKYQDKKIDVIITTDDAALKFVLAFRKAIFSETPIVFCGVNQNGIENIIGGQDEITGVTEVIDPTETIKLALDINPSLKNIYLLYDNLESGQSTGKIVTDKINAVYPELTIIPCNDMMYEDLVKQVQVLEQDSIVLITTYYSDVSGKLYDMDFVNRNISINSSVPVYQIYDIALNSGILGGTLLSGRLQGEDAASLALRIINGENADDIPLISSKSTRVVFDYQQLVRFDIPFHVLPRDSEIINKPFSFYETYKALVLSILTAFIVLITFVGILLFYIKKIRLIKNKLTESNEELTQIYEELTASDEEMKSQYNEMLMINEKIRIGEEKLIFVAYHDSLTGLQNKLSLYEHSKQIFTPERGKVALLFIDLDNFKYVNDTLGHAFGDQLIIKVSERLSALLEGKDSLYRLSGDEFIMIVSQLQDTEEIKRKASYIISSFLEEFDIHKSVLHISISIGIALYPEHGNELEQLLKYADIAMYRAKETGKKNYMLYNKHMNEVFTERVNIEKHLQQALEHEEFEVYYQPQLNLKTNKVTGFEALLRWWSPQLGSVSPLKFIKVAEDTHFIIPLGTWVLKSACAFLKKLNEKGFGDMTVSVNISILQLLQTDFCDIVEETLSEMQINPKYLELEITESILMESFESVGSELERLCNMNIRIALDDFGKGYSSLNYLRQLPISTLKVDKSFIDQIVNESEKDLIGHIITIGKSMGMCIVAEGVESQEQLDYLVQHECDKIQGYLYSKPIPEADAISLLER